MYNKYKIIFWVMCDNEPLTSNNLGILSETFETLEDARKYMVEDEIKTLEKNWKDTYDGDKAAVVSFNEFEVGTGLAFDVFQKYGDCTCYTTCYKIVKI